MKQKQTAVEWLEDKLNNVRPTQFCSIETIKEWVKQAKEMEKEQIVNAHLIGLIRPLEIEATKQAEQYYNEEYGKL